MRRDTVRSAAEFLERLEALGDDLRRTIELECERFSPDPAASQARAARAKGDYGFFCETYFPHYIRSPHRSTFQRAFAAAFPALIDSEADAREVWMESRGGAKSTYTTQLGTLWLICTARKHFGFILMDSSEQAMEMLEAIKAELDSNPRLAMDFPEACGQGRVWQASTIITANDVKVRAGGSGKRIRGTRHGPYRPDFVFVDDLENDENVRQKVQRDKTESWVLSVVTNLGPPDGGMDVFYVGTSLHYDAAINRIGRAPGWALHVFQAIERWPDNMTLWERWEETLRVDGLSAADAFYAENRAALEAGAVVSWPGVRPLKKLMLIRAANHEEFEREYQNAPGNDEAAPFKTIQFWTDRGDWVFFGACDPSLGRQGAARDPSAILVGGLDRRKMRLDVVEADICRRVPDAIINRLLDLQAHYGCIAWAIETVQFQAFLYSEIIKRAALRGIAFPGVSVVPINDKDLRIVSLQPHVANGLIRLHRTQTTLIEQLKFWPEADHDDGPDGLEMLWSIATQFGGEWSYTPVRSDRGRERGGPGFDDGWDDDED